MHIAQFSVDAQAFSRRWKESLLSQFWRENGAFWSKFLHSSDWKSCLTRNHQSQQCCLHLVKFTTKFRGSLTLFFLPVSHNISTSLHFCHGERGAVVCRRRLGRRFRRCHRRSVRVFWAQWRRDREAPGVQRAGRWILCCCHHHSLLLVTPQIFSHFENSILLSLSSMIFCRVPYLSGGLLQQPILKFHVSEFCTWKCDIFPQRKKREKSPLLHGAMVFRRLLSLVGGALYSTLVDGAPKRGRLV